MCDDDVPRGFCIDVSVLDPIGCSVAKAFYERGWHDIDSEPVRHRHGRLVGATESDSPTPWLSSATGLPQGERNNGQTR